MRFDPRSIDESRERDVYGRELNQGSRGGLSNPREREALDPRDVFTRDLELPRGREPVFDPHALKVSPGTGIIALTKTSRSTRRRVQTMGAVKPPIDAATTMTSARSLIASTTASAYSDQPAVSSSAGSRIAIAWCPREASSGTSRCHSHGSPPPPGIRA
jgi:hypothetical protein